MLTEKIKTALKRLESNDASGILLSLQEVESELPQIADGDLEEIISTINAIFYFDTYEYPELQIVVDRAIRTLSSLGERVIPHLLKLLGDSDFKVEFNYALIFGIIGAGAVKPLLEAYQNFPGSTERSFIIYSLGKIHSPAVKEAIGVVIEEVKSDRKEIRDSAARTIGKIVECVDSTSVDSVLKVKMYDYLASAIGDEQPGIRSKACRSLGKMLKRGYLSSEQIVGLRMITADILGRGEKNWDSAFVVRKEAAEVEEILNKLAAKG